MGFYDGGQLLSQVDIDGNTPEIYIVTSNNSAGKTTWFNRYLIKRFKEHNEKFMLLYRFTYELDGVEDTFFNDIRNLFFKNDTFNAKKKDKGIYTELYLNDVLCGYAIALNLADQIKKKSHLFNSVERILFDEFISETSHYCSNEVEKFIAVHKAVARGNGKHSRYVPVFMVGNPYSILNPYYSQMGISSRLNNKVKFLKGNGWVLEQGFNASASEALKNSSFNKIFANTDYMKYSTEAVYMDDCSFIEKPEGQSKYILTIRYENNEYAIRSYDEIGIVYCDDKIDKSFPIKYVFKQSDHNVDSLMINRYNITTMTLRKYFESGRFRFKNLLCKEAVIALIK